MKKIIATLVFLSSLSFANNLIGNWYSFDTFVKVFEENKNLYIQYGYIDEENEGNLGGTSVIDEGTIIKFEKPIRLEKTEKGYVKIFENQKYLFKNEISTPEDSQYSFGLTEGKEIIKAYTLKDKKLIFEDYNEIYQKIDNNEIKLRKLKFKN